MLQIAAALERAHDPDPTYIEPLQNPLVNDNGTSPLYNRRTPAGELDGTLRRIRVGLETQSADPTRIEAEHGHV
jgi:hypothetical protein